MQTKEYKVVLAEDHPSTQYGIREGLVKAGINVIGIANDGVEALDICFTLKPDIIILDIEMPKKSGFDVANSLRSEKQRIKILVLSAHNSDHHIFSMIEAGIDGYVLKEESIETIIEAICTIMQDKVWFSSRVTKKILEHVTRNNIDGDSEFNLTEREIQILDLVALGKTDREIGREIFICERTVRYHLKNIYNKIGVDGRIEAIVWAFAHNIITPSCHLGIDA